MVESNNANNAASNGNSFIEQEEKSRSRSRVSVGQIALGGSGSTPGYNSSFKSKLAASGLLN